MSVIIGENVGNNIIYDIFISLNHHEYINKYHQRRKYEFIMFIHGGMIIRGNLTVLVLTDFFLTF